MAPVRNCRLGRRGRAVGEATALVRHAAAHHLMVFFDGSYGSYQAVAVRSRATGGMSDLGTNAEHLSVRSLDAEDMVQGEAMSC